MSGISVIICCYNSAGRLPQTLRHLALQKGMENTAWEVVVVNNRSTDDTEQVAIKEWQQYQIPINLRVITEDNAGLSHARERGIQESVYPYLVFCDDDNWLCEDYLQKVWHRFETDERIGIIGGEGVAVCEGGAPSWFEEVQIMYAVGKQSATTGDITRTGNTLYGAGMAVRKQLYQELKKRDFAFVLSDRKGKSLSSGGDSELCLAAIILGYKLFYDPELRFFHFISKERLTRQYLKRLGQGMAISNILLKPYHYSAFDTKESRIKQLWLYETGKTLYEYFLLVKQHKWKGAKTAGAYLARLAFLIRLNHRYDQHFHTINTKLKQAISNEQLANLNHT